MPLLVTRIREIVLSPSVTWESVQNRVQILTSDSQMWSLLSVRVLRTTVRGTRFHPRIEDGSKGDVTPLDQYDNFYRLGSYVVRGVNNVTNYGGCFTDLRRKDWVR